MRGQREGRKLHGAFLELEIRKKDETRALYFCLFVIFP